MTEKRARALHRAMWRWMAKHPGSIKDEWPGWWIAEQDDEVYEIFSNGYKCFACFIVDDDCEKCPIRAKAGKCGTYIDLLSEYQMMDYYTPRAEWAAVCNRIADAWREIPEGNHE